MVSDRALTRGRTDTGAESAEQLARYRAQQATASFDACGQPVDGHYDELFDAEGHPRARWSELSDDFAELGVGGLDRLDARVRRLVADDGITYTEVGHDGSTPWRLDPVPLPVAAADWARLEAGLVQRSRVLDEVLTDVYGPRRLLNSGLLPPEVVFGHLGYVRAAHGITVPGQHQLFLHGCDVSRWGDGRYRVLADRTETPAGIGYALADRDVIATAIPESFEHADPRPLGPFARALRLLLLEAAQSGDGNEPIVVVLSPGARAETAFDQAYLASTLGFPLVQGTDLVVHEGALWLRSLGRLKRVDVVLRRVDARSCDPLDLRGDSELGVVGLVEVLRRGAVTVVNTLGSGVLENPALARFLPRVARELCGEQLKLESAPSYWGGDDAERSHLLTNLHRLVLRSAVDGKTVLGPQLSIRQRAELKTRIQHCGWQWVGQEPEQFAVAPAVSAGGLVAAPVSMRVFSVARREGYMAMSGALGQLRARGAVDRTVTKVAAKDVWVRAERSAPAAISETIGVQSKSPLRGRRHADAGSPRVLGEMFRMGRAVAHAEVVVRLLVVTRERHQDYRYRPWLVGGEALPVLLSALANLTGTTAPDLRIRTKQTMTQADSAVAGSRIVGDLSTADDRPPSGDQIDARIRIEPPSGACGSGSVDVGVIPGADTSVPPVGEAASAENYAADSGTTSTVTGHDYLVSLTVDRKQPGSLAHSVDEFACAAKSVRDQLSADTWMILGAIERALNEYRNGVPDSSLSAVHSLALAGLLALAGIDAESHVRDVSWHLHDLGKCIERGLAVAELFSVALARVAPAEAERVIAESVLLATESSVTFRRRHGDSASVAALAELLLFDPANPRSLAYQLDRLDAGFAALPAVPGSARAARILDDAKRLLWRVDPDDLALVADSGDRTELVDLLTALRRCLIDLADAVTTSILSSPSGTQPFGARSSADEQDIR